MGNDGGWCWLTISRDWRGQSVVPAGSLVSKPAHGTVQIGPADGVLRVAYRPDAGFAGQDVFKVRVVGFGARDTVPVHVTVGK
jgi:hypothetical protein